MPEWKLIKDELPVLEHFCLLYNYKEEYLWIGCRTFWPEAENWFWSDSHGDFWWSKKEKKYNGTMEIDD